MFGSHLAYANHLNIRNTNVNTYLEEETVTYRRHVDKDISVDNRIVFSLATDGHCLYDGVQFVLGRHQTVGNVWLSANCWRDENIDIRPPYHQMFHCCIATINCFVACKLIQAILFNVCRFCILKKIVLGTAAKYNVRPRVNQCKMTRVS